MKLTCVKCGKQYESELMPERIFETLCEKCRIDDIETPDFINDLLKGFGTWNAKSAVKKDGCK